MPRRLKVVVEADGGARGNPGPAGYGAVVREASTGEVLAERSSAIGVATNNVAEYEGLIAGLQAAAELGAVEVDVRMDSKLVVEQMSGRWRINHPGLRPLAAKAAGLVRAFDTVSYTWVPRERNKQADALANAAMDAAAATTAAGAGPSRKPAAAQRPAGGGSWEPPPAASATRLVLVRHGETELTEQRRYSGRGDVPLTARGLAQAEATAARVAALLPSVAAVVTSPLRRCTATAEIVAAACGGPPVVVEEELVECDFGAWEGKTFAQVRAGWPQEIDAWLASTSVAPPDGESFAEVATRVGRVRSHLLATYPERAVVVVSHVSPLKILLRDALAAGDPMLYRLYLDPGGLSIVDMWPDGGVAVRSVNDTAHLAKA
ncbi:MAG TPA: bifunctional RNase H/acid phosphatase [Micromonosporaceae bacterium]|nr:bifunctional RNase H/acid phosphatase [Micromonosporaceae bacterium]